MSIDYQVIDTQGAIITKSIPFQRTFFTFNRSSGMAYLSLELWTRYTNADFNNINNLILEAKVWINGFLVGSIPPTYVDDDTFNPRGGAHITLPFDNSILSVMPFPSIGINSLLIIPDGAQGPGGQNGMNDPNNYLNVWLVVCTYRQS